MIKAFIFDIDNTLYKSKGFAIKLILANPFDICKLRLERKCRKQLMGRTFNNKEEYYSTLFSMMRDDSILPSKRYIGKCEEWFWQRYLPSQVKIICEQFVKRDSLNELITNLKSKGMKVAVLSDYGMAREKIIACGLDTSLFDGIWEAPELGGLKPCEDTFLKACSELGVNPNEAIMVGDKLDADGGAMAVGMNFIHMVEEKRNKDTKEGEVPNPLYTEMTWDEFLRANR